MESPVRKMLKRNDYNRHKLFRKIKRRRKAAVEQQSKAAEKELKRRLRWTAPKFEDGKDAVMYPTLIDTNYDQYRAQQLGYGPADNGHYPSRDRITGDILKYPQHPTFLKALLDDARLLYLPTKDRKKGRSRTDTWNGNENILNNVNYFDHSYHGLSDFDSGKNMYVVLQGDNLWNIAKRNNISLEKLRNFNPQLKGDLIHPGDQLKVAPQIITELVDLVQLQQLEDQYNQDNLKAIMNAQHDGNYVIIDKPNSKLDVYDKNNNLLYTTPNISTGASLDDYNTITYVDENGHIVNGAGNNSTPAGILQISGTGTYHGYPSFTRSRVGSDGKGIQNDNVASSFHIGPTSDKKASNGCVRISGNDLNKLAQYVGIGTMTYTLPEKPGSRFTLKDGQLNFTADNPYGTNTGKEKYWDDYNTTINKQYNPLVIVLKQFTKDYNHDGNALQYGNTISVNKQAIQHDFNLTSDEYNRIAQLAMGIAEQESGFGTGKMYKTKSIKVLGNIFQDVALFGRRIVNLKNPFGHEGNSKGMTQIKLEDDLKNQELSLYYLKYGITDEKDLQSADKSALATMARLCYIYNTEVKGRTFKQSGNKNMDKYDALLYAYNGRSKHARSGRANPSKNAYINKIKKYSKNFDYYAEHTREI